MRLFLIIIAACGALGGQAHATQCSGEHIEWARASAKGQILVRASFGTVLSTDHGKTWKPVKGIGAVVDEPYAAGDGFVAQTDSASYGSSDFGLTWTFISNDRRAPAAGQEVVHDAGGGVLYGTQGDRENAYLIRSDDGGSRWRPHRPLYPRGMESSYEKLLLGQKHTLYVLGGGTNDVHNRKISTLYRVTGGKAEKLLAVVDNTSWPLRTPPLNVAADGAMIYVNADNVWISLANGKGWRHIPGSFMTSKPWLECHGPVPGSFG
ncbi:exo-alpha-sialidase [Massilia violaceinigra]|uniref:Exo-alpha-sialidase n=1 Tax=Massilia violaceinigra TaxID=2045208 RepID=A0ABY4A6G8_9BURK|nr:sialidase family protein [Massilia violaceinigra]UOD30380.1 exo-alpha-sialidase [Massilia violaceinigra]